MGRDDGIEADMTLICMYHDSGGGMRLGGGILSDYEKV